MKAWVTGARGFVGGWLCAHLREHGDDVLATGEDVDVTDADAVRKTLDESGADVIYHLAARTHVGRSWEAPQETFLVNALGTLNIVDAARRVTPSPRVLAVSSAEVYGAVASDDLPITEDAPVRPLTPYASSKAAAELVALQAHLGSAVPALCVRPFNHTGPGQPASFVVPDFAKRIIDAERSGQRELRIGNPTPRRDFTDVRDVVRAYRLVAEEGEPGAVYNVCSGRDLSIMDLAEALVRLSGVDLEITVAADLSRAVDVPRLQGDGRRLQQATGWAPLIPLEDTLTDILEFWRRRSEA